ncbi:folate-binding protein [Luteimonas sp. 3794]|uniref:CAF17-like 4Fe-4S cluster assembly/insertion protein YgfZ n=1 Tax=Luteimonas sp. 3794 TaxID=2817730 RepID=UPI00285C0ADC|nr:folate-binding protein [Luteimonas sp. 3794]MDR6992605.1 folate-binding protein YgfZ [Luteimonas sp. 3794]
MSDIAALGDGQWQWSGWLTPKGRVIALFAVLRHSAERLDLIVLDADIAALATSLKRYVFRSKVSIEVGGGVSAMGQFALPSIARGATAAIDASAVELDLGSPSEPRSLTLREADPVIAVDEDAQRRWRAFDITHGLPRLDADQREQWTPQQLSLERLRAFSVAKGCYPGQEIVARTHFLGQAKRGLAVLRGAPDAAAGEDVRAGEQVQGKVVSVAGDLVLAVLPLERLDAPLQIGGIDVVDTPLLDGLAR